MKKLSFVFIVYICFVNLAKSQSKLIEIDFRDMKTSTIDLIGIKKGETYQVKICNINLNLFKVSLTSADSILSKPLQTPTFGVFNIDELSKVIAGIGPLSTSVTLTETSHWTELIGTMDKLKDTPFFDPIIVPSNNNIIVRMDNEKKELSAAKTSVESLSSKIDDLKLEVYKLRLNASKLSNPPSNFNFNLALISIETIRKDITKLKDGIAVKKGLYGSFSETNKVEIAAKTDLSTNDKSIKDTYDKFLTILSDALTSVSADKANELLSSIVFLENNTSNTYLSMPIQFLGDQAKVKLSIVPRDEKFNLQSYSSQITFPKDIYTYTVVGMSFYLTNLYSKAYSTLKTKVNDSTSVYNFKEENYSKSEIGIAAQLRIGKKWEKHNNFGVHFGIGTGVSISNKIKPRFLFGGGVSVGKKHMLALDFGGIVGYVDRLSNAVDLSKTYAEKPETITVSKLGWGVVGSIGYIYQF